MRANPHVLEISVRPWLRQLREKYGAQLTLAAVPDEELQEFKHLGFDAVWLMGVWTASPRARETARKFEPLLKSISEIRKDYRLEDVEASPFAVYDYSPDPEFGTETDLRVLHARFNAIGLNLLLDFVPNHLAIDHPFAASCPECFVQAGAEEAALHPDWFFRTEGGGFLAYGRDPNFPPWRDTVQLNYFNPKTRRYMLETLGKIAAFCDGVRCDMVMLSLNDVHDGTWGWLLRRKGFARPEREFWPDAIAAVQAEHPHFMFLAEVYWGLEWRLQEMGVDYTYDKVLYDRLRYLGPGDVKGHLRAEKLYQKRSIRFIENHDEVPAVAAFGKLKSFAAAIAVSTLRGMRLFNYGQLQGIGVKIPVQYGRCDFPGDAMLEKMYDKLLKIADHPAFHGGEWALVEPRSAAQGNETHRNLLCWSWTQRRTFKLVIVNYADARSIGRVPITAAPKGDSYAFYDELAEIFLVRPLNEVQTEGLFVELPPFGAHMLDMEF